MGSAIVNPDPAAYKGHIVWHIHRVRGVLAQLAAIERKGMTRPLTRRRYKSLFVKTMQGVVKHF